MVNYHLTKSENRRKRVDSLFVRNQDFIGKIENKQNILKIKNEIKTIVVDYTVADYLKYITPKFYKDYQSSDRLLIIVLDGLNADSNKLKLQTKINRKGLENIEILTASEYKTFLGLKDKSSNDYDQLSKDYDLLQKLITDSYTSKIFLDKLKIMGSNNAQYLTTTYGTQKYYNNYIGNKKLDDV